MSRAKHIHQAEHEEGIVGAKPLVPLGCGAETDDSEEDGEAACRNDKDYNLSAAVVVRDTVDGRDCRSHEAGRCETSENRRYALRARRRKLLPRIRSCSSAAGRHEEGLKERTAKGAYALRTSGPRCTSCACETARLKRRRVARETWAFRRRQAGCGLASHDWEKGLVLVIGRAALERMSATRFRQGREEE